MHHDSINSRPSEGFDDFENDEEGSQTPVHSKPGIGNSEAVRSPPQLPPLMEETASPTFDGNIDFYCPLVHFLNLDKILNF